MRTFVYIGLSLDGYIAKKDGDIEWLTKYGNEELFTLFAEFIKGIDAIVIGRNTYEKVLSFPTWPYEKKVFVLSSTLKLLPESLNDKAGLLSMRPREILNYLSANGFSNIYVDGGKVIQDFLKEDLIDEMILTRIPVVLGGGIPLFGELDDMLTFEHKSTKVFSDGLVRSDYVRKKK